MLACFFMLRQSQKIFNTDAAQKAKDAIFRFVSPISRFYSPGLVARKTENFVRFGSLSQCPHSPTYAPGVGNKSVGAAINAERFER